MRQASRAIALAAVLVVAGCGGDSSGTTLPPDSLDHDASAAFAGRWLGILQLSTGGQNQSVNAELDVTVTGRNTLTFPGFCGDGGGPTARVTSDSAFTVASHACPIPTTSCTVTWQIRGGSGSLSAGTIHLSADGPASGCNAPAGATLSLVFSGTKSIAAPSSISSLTPSSASAGSAGFTLQVNGTGFPGDAVVQWNGSPRPTTFVDTAHLQAQIAAADVAVAGSAQITVASASSGTTSQPVSFLILGPQAGVIVVSLPARDMVWDPARQKIYASIDNASPTNPNTITIIDPFTGTFDAGTFAGSQPNRLAISGDGQFLYAGIDGAAAVQRFTLPALAPDLRISLGSDPSFGAYTAGDLQVAPGASRTLAVTLFTPAVSPAAQGGVVIFDDATARPTRAPGFSGTGFVFGSLQWGADATALYAANNEDTGFDFYTLSVDASGVRLVHDFGGAFSGFVNRIHFDPVTRLVYADDGHVIDPATGLPAGSYGVSGPMVPDGSAGVAVFLSLDVNASTTIVHTFDLTRFTTLGTFAVQHLAGQPTGSVLRFGSNGVAFTTNAGELVLTHAPGLP